MTQFKLNSVYAIPAQWTFWSHFIFCSPLLLEAVLSTISSWDLFHSDTPRALLYPLCSAEGNTGNRRLNVFLPLLWLLPFGQLRWHWWHNKTTSVKLNGSHSSVHILRTSGWPFATGEFCLDLDSGYESGHQQMFRERASDNCSSERQDTLKTSS